MCIRDRGGLCAGHALHLVDGAAGVAETPAAHFGLSLIHIFWQFAVFAGQTVELCGRIWYTMLYLYAPGKGAAKGERLSLIHI